MLTIKSFPAWAGTIQYNDKDYDMAIMSGGCIVDGREGNLKYLHLVKNRGEIHVYFSGDEKLLKIER